LGAVYKLVELVQNGRRRYAAKFSEDKATYPGAKQAFRISDAKGNYERDVIGCADEQVTGAEALLACVMEHGRRVVPSPSLAEIRDHAKRSLARLPLRHRELKNAEPYPVKVSERQKQLLRQVKGEAGR